MASVRPALGRQGQIPMQAPSRCGVEEVKGPGTRCRGGAVGAYCSRLPTVAGDMGFCSRNGRASAGGPIEVILMVR